jgi:RNA polymerase sigma-70 factor (ECF subfamily)
VDPSSPDSIVTLSLLPAEIASGRAVGAAGVGPSVLALFDRCAPQLLRYVTSLGLNAAETEDVVQEVFLALFRHLRLGRDASNLTGWLFRVAHNLALRQRHKIRRRAHDSRAEAVLRRQIDPAPDPETRLAQSERRRRLQAVVDALPERERRCVFLRAEGLSYRDIGAALCVSLGTVAKSLTRAMTRLANADGG